MDKDLENPTSKKAEAPTLNDAIKDRKEFDSLVGSSPDDPRVDQLKTKAELWANYIFQSAGSIPAGDLRHRVFEEYNAILESWGKLKKTRQE